MTNRAKIKAFIEATNLHCLEGKELGLSDKDVATVLLAYATAAHVLAWGADATRKALTDNADAADATNG